MKKRSGYLGYFVHGINFWLLMIDLVIGRYVFYLTHTLSFLLFALTFCVWSVVHYWTRVGLPKEKPCDDYSLNECPIYAVLDWHDTGSTLLKGVILFCCVL